MASDKFRNLAVVKWVEDAARLCQPGEVRWCDGSAAEYQALCDLLVRNGTFTRLNPQTRPGSYLARSHPSDVARVEDRTYICSSNRDDAGPTNNWADPAEMKQQLNQVFQGCMRGQIGR